MKLTKETKDFIKHLKRMSTPEMKKTRVKFEVARMKADKKKKKK